MKTKLSFKEYIVIAVMLFGMFFGAGNLIFPSYMGQLAGKNVLSAVLGFTITGVGIPLLGVAAIGLSRSSGVMELASKVSRRYGLIFTTVVCLTIGPFFAIPRCATVPFTVTVTPLLGNVNETVSLAVYSLIFFVIVLAFSLKPGKIMTYVGKFLTPVFLVFLGALVVTALINPMGAISEAPAIGTYETSAFFNGFLEGYNTMDAIAGLVFGIVVVNAVKSLGVEDPGAIALCTTKAGILSCVIMAVIYFAVAFVGAESYAAGVACENGGEVLTLIATNYFGRIGSLLLAVTVTVACLKTSVGLVVSIGETFEKIFPKGPKYRTWAIIFCAFSFCVANVGLNGIIAYSLPVLMLLYPLVISLTLLGLAGPVFNNDRGVYAATTIFAFVPAVFDFVKALPEGIITTFNLEVMINFAEAIFPFYNLGIGWVIPAIVGFVIGFVLYKTKDSANTR